MTFARVNGGVAFALYEPFESADANALRTNDDHLWASLNRELRTSEFNGTTLAGGTPTSGTLGPFCYAPEWGAYIAAATPRGSTTPGYMAIASPGGSAQALPLASLPTGILAAGVAPLIVQVKDSVTEAPRTLLLYMDATDGHVGVAIADASMVFTRVYYGVTSIATALPPIGCSPLVANANATRVAVGGALTYTALVLCSVASGTATCWLKAGTTATGAPTSMAINATKTRLIACASGSLHVLSYDTDTDALTTQSTPMHASADAAPSTRRVAYDPVTGKFIMMTLGDYTGLGNGYIYWTSGDGVAAWSATVGWKRAYLGFQEVGTPVSALCDFTITEEGVWLVAVLDKRDNAASLGVVRVLMSIDQGATWNFYGAWARGSSSATLRFSRGGPGVVLLENAGGVIDWVSTTGAAPTSAAITSESL